MRYISCKLDDLKKIVLPIGYEGENEHTRVQVDAGEVFKEYPAAVPSLKVHGPTGAIYPAEVTRDGKNVIWDIKVSDCAADGSGEAQFTFTLNNVIVKSCIAKIKVYRSIVGGSTPPDPVQDWIDDAEEVLDDLAAMDNIAKTAEAGDIGKALSPKTVENGVVTEWQYVEPGAGTEDYTDLENKPQIGGVELSGDKSLHDLGIAAESAIPDVSGKANLSVVAPAFDQATANDAGSLVTYTDGVVYVLPEGHTAGTTWANTQKTATSIAEQQRLLLNDIQGLNENAVQYVLARKIYVGENLISNETTVVATGWNGSIGNGFTHSSGNTNPLTFEVSITEGNKYIVEFDWTNYGEGRIGVGIGDSPTADPYNGTNHAFVGFVADGGYLKINPISSYTGTIENVKIRPVEAYGDELIQQCKNVSHGSNENEITGWFNVALGPEAMRYNQNGTRNMAFGYGAMQKLISGNRNVAIGTYSMPFVSEGESNIAIGSDTLYNWQMSSGKSVANNNIAIGKATMRNGNLIEDNIAIGKGAMSENALNAKENIAIGKQAGYNASQYNTFIGVRAGYYFNGDGGESNTCIGHEAGFSPNHNGKNNVFIGKGARPLVPGASASTPKTVNNSIAIGKDAKATKSYQCVIGNTNITEVVIAGKILTFNQDGTVTWSEQ